MNVVGGMEGILGVQRRGGGESLGSWGIPPPPQLPASPGSDLRGSEVV